MVLAALRFGIGSCSGSLIVGSAEAASARGRQARSCGTGNAQAKRTNFFPCSPAGRRSDAMLLHSNQGDRIYQRSDGPCRWGMISVSPKNLAAYARALAHVHLSPPPTPALLRPSSSAARNSQRLYARACRLAETKPQIVAHKEVARALEEDLLYAPTHCLIDEGARRDRGPKRHRVLAMARFEDVLSSHCHRPLPLPELCAAIGVPERTLWNCSAQFLRMSPVTYSRLRRLNLVRTALRQADPASVSVGDVARQHGFSELGRFAVTYRTLFGETPSTTLRGESSI
jgi:AraC-like DNA-binding protein